jgi:outer membrane protein assembly factor BamA
MQFVSYERLFIPRKLIHYVTLRRGDLYKQTNLLQTQNKFNSIGAWRLVSISQLPRKNQDTVDFDIRLTPARKYAFTANLEGSKNQSANILEGNYLGLGVNVGLNNRNFAKAANQAITNFRYGIELNSAAPKSFIQTNQISLSHTITFPRLVPRFPRLKPMFRENARTFLTFNVNEVDRVDYFKVIGTGASWGYEISWKNKLLNIRIPNIEYNLLERRDSLEKLIKNNASYKYIFNDGLILSTPINLRIANGKPNGSRTNLINLSFEPSGYFASLIFKSPFFDSNLYRFVKLDAEFVQTFKIPHSKNSFAWRFFAGAGYELPSNTNRNNKYLPFFRQYYDGGANSMRAWAVRRLGPGSALKSFNQDIAPDRFGDMRLEMNAEYRFYLTQFFGFPLESALYTDIGNVWFIRSNPDFIGGEFKFNKLWKDIAIGTGTGLRIDFGFLKLRLDYAYKVKNPTPDINEAETQNKWFHNWKPFNGQFQLGIGYPF